ncbi:putative 3-oxoacyl-acyl-carrier protein synthase I/II [Toxoplasma gondii TgCatPRC2]|uniref:Nodulation protein E n=10 Tax=Toxoplasma gondii TaxID=5811 RepID=A0A0F7UNF6_TOXGV|nr:3-oxoacyl-acyl-carrier protein synthase I/II, putative [Toxoplasma gondii ME49]EPR57624.1 putative 3-oxoacyl-acyl-carrier protein synthase I/II [Toxoplasma gondii GT1]ESS29255.1 putative 3-oxoacyl-acyl-carrier protein synthase I/II [Toxoplasma gondii VEG]KAF4646102.1 putative 3-oxoacyl-acyl-carrier protein synthase I/II [Toxoplasma gondii]KFG35676.1 putative 3-oxoacyl-acyl-carrier protein synthase I/II [Toxoplasma gondii p89]KFH14348.1 putative 3-oxoacyl-acyl-carrier protein synthase I/II [|eukprot:XP_002370161.1 3-oxoacyl-acyl-carrier protein synthase I/II, putative [Toxoplasma gondii ME49]
MNPALLDRRLLSKLPSLVSVLTFLLSVFIFSPAHALLLSKTPSGPRPSLPGFVPSSLLSFSSSASLGATPHFSRSPSQSGESNLRALSGLRRRVQRTLGHQSSSGVQTGKLSTTLRSSTETCGVKGRPRVVCTGLGVVSGVGIGIDEFWKNLIAGTNVIDKVTRFDPSNMTCQIACEVSNEKFDPKAFFTDPKEVKRNDRYTHFAVAGARLAMEDAGLSPRAPNVDPERFGIVVGSGIGGLETMEQEMKVLQEKGPRRVSPFLIPAMIANTASGILAIELGAKGPNHGAVSACATSGHAAGVALRYLQMGEADIVICGGAEASITPLSFAGFNALKAMAQGFNDDPKRASRPFDKKRAGFVMGEGAGIMVFETEEHAVRRGAPKIYGEVAGYGASCDAHHITAPAPDGSGLSRCLENAIADANIDKRDIGYINAHGTSTPMNDRIETKAFKKVFGDEQARQLLISSTKSMTGHCLGATGGIEACVSAKVLETGIVPPTINQEETDPECDLNYVPNKAYTSPTPFEAVLSDTLGFGGHNAALLLRRYRNRPH